MEAHSASPAAAQNVVSINSKLHEWRALGSVSTRSLRTIAIKCGGQGNWNISNNGRRPTGSANIDGVVIRDHGLRNSDGYRYDSEQLHQLEQRRRSAGITTGIDSSVAATDAGLYTATISA